MKKIIPLVVSGCSTIGKSAFASRLVKEHPELFTLTMCDQKDVNLNNETARETKIPIFEASEVAAAEELYKTLGEIKCVFIMPPNIETFRTRLEKNTDITQNKINRTADYAENEVKKAYSSYLYNHADFIIDNNDFEKSYT